VNRHIDNHWLLFDEEDDGFIRESDFHYEEDEGEPKDE